MQPEEIEVLEDATFAEKQVFLFLRHAARPDMDFIGWYEPIIGKFVSKPDFILYGNSLGLLVLEGKDLARFGIWMIKRSYSEKLDPMGYINLRFAWA